MHVSYLRMDYKIEVKEGATPSDQTRSHASAASCICNSSMLFVICLSHFSFRTLKINIIINFCVSFASCSLQCIQCSFYILLSFFRNWRMIFFFYKIRHHNRILPKLQYKTWTYFPLCLSPIPCLSRARWRWRWTVWWSSQFFHIFLITQIYR